MRAVRSLTRCLAGKALASSVQFSIPCHPERSRRTPKTIKSARNRGPSTARRLRSEVSSPLRMTRLLNPEVLLPTRYVRYLLSLRTSGYTRNCENQAHITGLGVDRGSVVGCAGQAVGDHRGQDEQHVQY